MEPKDQPIIPVKLGKAASAWTDLPNVNSTEQLKHVQQWLRKPKDKLATRRTPPGYRVLFDGSDAEAKQMAAGLLAKEANLEIYRVDLSMIVSKYIGETEKKLNQLFEQAEEKGWILFLDEADALFGKRTNVKDAHDRYANQEVSYLLQRIEEHKGLVIISSNSKGHIDAGFLRRFHAVLQFPPK